LPLDQSHGKRISSSPTDIRMHRMPFQAVATQRLYQHVAEQVSALIRAGELAVGSRLPPERELAKRLGVSRPTVREAMVALEIAGLIEVRTGSGIYVIGETQPGPVISFDAGPGAFELLSARLLIEPEIAAQAATMASARDIEALRETLSALADAENHRASQDPDRRFHTLIAGATGSNVLVSIVDGLWESMFSPIFEALSHRAGLPENRRMTLADHRVIIERIEARDAPGARRAMRTHLENVRAVLSSHEDNSGRRAAG
jgi:DNA-binding FadR family transcriptional regulator